LIQKIWLSGRRQEHQQMGFVWKLSHCNTSDVPYSNVLKLVEFCVCLELMDQPSKCSPWTICGRVRRPSHLLKLWRQS
jgi:hypothetical protein